MKSGCAVLAVLVVCLFTSVFNLFAYAATTEWSGAALDQVLANVQPGQKTARIDDMEILVSNLQAWRNELAGLPQPKLAFDGNAPTWTSGNVYYTFSNNVSAAKQKVFLDSAAEWSLFANLHFIPRTTQPNYVTIYEDPTVDGGVSYVGMTGGQQFMWFGTNGWNHGTVLHEMGHTLGLIHEQQRSDRDSYVTVITNNATPAGLTGLIKLTNTRNQTPYDFLSIMHYAQWAGSSNPPTLPTMVPLPAYARFANIMGQGDPKLTPYDRAGMANIYGAGPALSPVVTNTQDSGLGSLRAALYYAYDHVGTTITFNIPANDPGLSNGVFTIKPTDILPSLYNATILDGTTASTNLIPGSPSVWISGVLAQLPSVFGSGLQLLGTNCVVRGLTVNGFNYAGIRLAGSNSVGNVVSGCYLGVDPTGTMVVTNGFVPLLIENGASANIIGGINGADRNIISGGVVIRNPGTGANVVEGNSIGIGVSETAFVPNGGTGVTIYDGASNNRVGGYIAAARNIISGNGWSGVSMSDSATTGNLVAGNYIGANSAGTAAISNAFFGVELDNGTAFNTIAGNVISGNASGGVLIRNPGTASNNIQGNYIGVTGTGLSALPNNGSGIYIYDGAHANTIGGYTTDARNVIAGNGWSGIALSDATTSANLIVGNHIGLDAMGVNAISNVFAGIELNNGTTQNQIGGTSIGARNVISGNGNAGIIIRNPGSSGNIVQGNLIGLNVSATAARPNAGAGILIYDGARSNLIGGLGFGAGNLIASNNSDGITLSDAATTNNSIRCNSMFGNHGSAIALNSSANRSTAVPFLFGDAQTTNCFVNGVITGLANTTYQLDFYSSPASPAQGMVYFGTASTTTSSGGSASFSDSLAGHVPAGRILTATATDPAGNTSVMSGSISAVATSSVNDGIPDAWRAQYFGGSGTTTNTLSCATGDPDHDGMNNLQEYLAGTNPTNSSSSLKISPITSYSSSNGVSFMSAPGTVYRVQYRDDLASGIWSIAPGQIVGTGSNIFITDPGVLSAAKRFYRLQVVW